jgi:ubiquinol-cytochrome c reductase cytochrome c subunit
MIRSIRHRRLLAGPAALFAIAITVFSVMFMTSGSAHGQQALVSTSPQDIAAGAVLYQTHCQSCHGYQGQGGVVKGAPELIDAGAAAADFYLSTGRMPLNAPNNEAERNRQVFTQSQIRQLVAYVNALPKINGTHTAGPTIPDVQPLCSDQTTPTTADQNCVTLAEGQALYAINCQQCHQAAGSGGMLSKENVIPSLRSATLIQSAEAPLIGPKPMPMFKEFTPHELSAIAHYVDYLHKPDSPGGAGISYFGPVAEGFVGILVGFVVLWFAARMIGTRG